MKVTIRLVESNERLMTPEHIATMPQLMADGLQNPWDQLWP